MDRTYSHIDLDERRRIARWRTAKLSVDVIAERLGRHRSTIFRELKRNQFNDNEIKDLNGYYCTIADQKSRERRSKQRKLIRYNELRRSVIDHISDGWSPQLIADELRKIDQDLVVTGVAVLIANLHEMIDIEHDCRQIAVCNDAVPKQFMTTLPERTSGKKSGQNIKICGARKVVQLLLPGRIYGCHEKRPDGHQRNAEPQGRLKLIHLRECRKSTYDTGDGQ